MFFPVLFLLLFSIVGFYLNKNKSIHLSKNQKLASFPPTDTSFFIYFYPSYNNLARVVNWQPYITKLLTIILGDSLSVMNSDEINLFLSKVKNFL